MKHKRLLTFYLGVMGVLIAAGFFFPERFTSLLRRPEFYLHAKFIHVLFVTLLFGNAVIGTLWEIRGLQSGHTEIVRHTYKTVAWLDSVFTAPLVIVSVVSGIMLGTILGGVLKIGWVTSGFFLFLLTGVLWALADIPNQYQLNRVLGSQPNDADRLAPEVARLVWRRMAINVLGISPLLVVFYLMVHKPPMVRLTNWLNGHHRTLVSTGQYEGR